MKRCETLIHSWLGSVIAFLSACALSCAAVGKGAGMASGKPFDAACVAVRVSELSMTREGAVRGTLSAENHCRAAVGLLLSPIRVDVVRRGQRIPWMGTVDGRNSFVRMLLLEDGIEIDSVFAGDAVQNVYAPLKGVSLAAGAAISIPIVGRLPKVEPLGASPIKAQLLLPCFPEPSAITETIALDLEDSVGRTSATGGEEPRRLADAAALVHTPPFAVRIDRSK